MNLLFNGTLDSMDFTDLTIKHQDIDNLDSKEAKAGRRAGRKSSEKMDMSAKLERSRQSARECRARKKLRYQYLEELVTDREKAVIALRKELEKYRNWGKELDEGRIPEGLEKFLEESGTVKQEIQV